MTDLGRAAARSKMVSAGVDRTAIAVFEHYYELLEQGATGMIPEDTIAPHDGLDALEAVAIDDDSACEAIRKTAVIKLNGGLATSMGMDRAKSLLCVRNGLSFLDIIARQVLHLRKVYDAPLPLIFMNSFKTSADTLAALARYEDQGLQVEGLPLDFLQNMEPRLTLDGLEPVEWPKDPTLEWCPPGHGDIYTALRGTGLLQKLIDLGFERVFVSNSDNLGAVPDARIAGWFAESGAPFAIEAVRRTASDRKGGHFAIRKSDGRIILRESAQVLDEDKVALADLGRHKFTSTNNIWFDLRAVQSEIEKRDGVLGLPLIRNEKNVDVADKTSPKVVQIETAMGAAIELFDGAQTIEVGRDRFIPVKTTNDLLVLRSDVYLLNDGTTLVQQVDPVPFVDLGPAYAHVREFDKRFPEGVPSLKAAEALRVPGDWTFEWGVHVVGDVTIEGERGRIEEGTVLGAVPVP